MEISISGVNKSYGKKTVLKDLNLTASSGECVGIIGRNGTGKSTMLSTLAGVIRPDSGTFIIDGKNAFTDENIRHNEVAYVPQGTPLIEELSALDNLKMWYEEDALKKSLKGGFLNLLGINDFLDVSVNKTF